MPEVGADVAEFGGADDVFAVVDVDPEQPLSRAAAAIRTISFFMAFSLPITVSAHSAVAAPML
jgi:hypothetical protein